MIPASARVSFRTLPGDTPDEDASGAMLCRVGVDRQIGWLCNEKKLSAASPCFSMRVRLS
jgi:hypothetical protein